jgi:ATP phosphoribosyltransferase regulatory subunit
MFHIFARGPGEAIGAGGRYDELLGRFGSPMPAVGFGLDLDNLVWALRDAGKRETSEVRVVLVGASNDPRLAPLRTNGVAVIAMADAEAAMRYAQAWDFQWVVDADTVRDPKSSRSFPSPYVQDIDCPWEFLKNLSRGLDPNSRPVKGA